ncbi:MlaC/ttg2D family ABC transporter substrate-binding protein [Quisquiliibacterium transsilvanicum]|jgi:phospholipid transport system substrate-binding protein|uniref:Phospholipid transport system substrate-binding protein n=1 Tax=Quisquiliibacterium transsilvanicum TaxID=1549638 RepID=A0A7W8HKZ1_9BURK|nr:ABC transporter substrate-binding protein [Quisquiliibacterium transsilvanicum]MBB5273083.1 phospholipid transport system substrate-binding protein [Quisquiliibacterium transsilvanicum]
MKRLFAFLFAALMLAPAVQAAEAPDVLIRRLSTEMIDRIRADEQLQSGNLARMSELVDSVLMPHVNFQRMTALAVGRNWRGASPEQQKQLMTEFRALLLRTYAGALASAKDQSVRMKPMRADPADKEVIVRSEVVQPRGGEPIQLDYRLEKAGDGWKVFDVNVLGVWLVQTYRSQFAQEVSANGIDGLIRSLVEKNRSAGAAGTR